MTFDTTLLGTYLTVVLGVALVAAVAVVATVTAVVVRNRRTRLARHESLRAFYGPRLALHH
jgi:hypothetical protein